ncbi:MAG: lanthionine synthetase LanC family protein, partial [Halobaculum sp.]
LGVGVYLAAVSATRGTVDADEVRRAASFDDIDAETVVEEVGLGMGKGIGSLVYGLSVLGTLTGENRYFERATRLATAVSDEMLAGTEQADVLLGVAGTLHGLAALYERTDEKVVLDRAISCGEQLLAARKPKWGTHVWDTHPGDASSCSTGMGHGAAGVCYGLYRLYDHTGRVAFKDAADDALQYENAMYTPAENNWWANWNDVEHFPRWWCYGVAGIGLARIGSLEHHDATHLRRDLDRAAGFEPAVGKRDALCHGTFSQVAFLSELARVRRDRHEERARELAERAVRRRHDRGAYQVACGCIDELANPSLFLGLPGIGYTLLRLVESTDLPSLLRFE